MNHVQRAIESQGSVAALARQLNVTTQAVCFWRDGKRKIPAEKCIEIERITDRSVRCEDLRPDADWTYLRNSAHSVDAAVIKRNKEAANV
jgi:DNA-binding transcriptional regulator YdaS (Cro superfamily)